MVRLARLVGWRTMAINRDSNRSDRELWARACAACGPVSGLCGGYLAFKKLPHETSHDFAARLQVAAWCEGEAVVGLVGSRRVVCLLGDCIERIEDSVEESQ